MVYGPALDCGDGSLGCLALAIFRVLSAAPLPIPKQNNAPDPPLCLQVSADGPLLPLPHACNRICKSMGLAPFDLSPREGCSESEHQAAGRYPVRACVDWQGPLLQDQKSVPPVRWWPRPCGA